MKICRFYCCPTTARPSSRRAHLKTRFDPGFIMFLFIFSPCVSFTVHNNNDRPHLRFYVPYTGFKLVQNNNRPCFCVEILSRSLSLLGRAPIVYWERDGGGGEHEALSYYIGHSRVLVVLSPFFNRRVSRTKAGGKNEQSLTVAVSAKYTSTNSPYSQSGRSNPLR